MILRFSQKDKKEKWEHKIRKFFNLASTRATPDLLVKVCFFNHPTRQHGNYRNLTVHGFYDKEWDMRQNFKTPINHIITLKLCEANEDDESLFRVIAHEYRHYLQYSGKKPKQLERDARRWADMRFKKVVMEGKLKPKQKSYFEKDCWNWIIREILSHWDEWGNDFEIARIKEAM